MIPVRNSLLVCHRLPNQEEKVNEAILNQLEEAFNHKLWESRERFLLCRHAGRAALQDANNLKLLEAYEAQVFSVWMLDCPNKGGAQWICYSLIQKKWL